MVVQHNLTAMNANRMLGITSGKQAKSSEKLSSGYRINRAADDAAGLSISEKMRKQINGLDRASTNAQDGVSAVQTAEGALTEVHSMLQRMNELAVQAANGTNSADDREAIQAEIEQLTTEIDRVAETTKFNETYLLKGSVDGITTQKTLAAHDAGLAGKFTMDNGAPKVTAGNPATWEFKLDEALATGKKIVIAGKEYEIVDNYNSFNGNGTEAKAAGFLTKTDADNAIIAELKAANEIGADGAATVTASASGSTYTVSVAKATIQAPLSFSLHVGTEADMTNKILVNVEAMTSAGLGIKDLSVAGDTTANATYAIDAIADAIKTVSTQRSGLGAIQNRLEHTISNLDNVVENTTAAESRIRDTDMAEEMVEYSKNNILAQAGQSMLAQANQSTQGVLSLLQ